MKSTKDILTRLDIAKKAINELESGKTEVILDNTYVLRITEKSFIFYDYKAKKRVSHIPRNCEHKTMYGGFGSVVPDNQYIDFVTKYLSLPVID